MTQSTHTTLLRRMTRSQDAEVTESPLTSSRAVRLALTKAANDTVGLVVTVSGVAEEVTQLDDMLGALADDLMLVELQRDAQLVGLIALDMQMRAAVGEMQTSGALLNQAADDRAATRTDKVLSEPVLAAFLQAFPSAVIGTDFEGWCDGAMLGDQIGSARAAGLVLEDCDYRIVRLSIDLGVADRQGLLLIALPLVQQVPEEHISPPAPIDWQTAFEERVSEAPACLDALLHRFEVPLSVARSLQVGTVLPLPGCTVDSVRLISVNGQEVVQAKLGQIGGKRAVRLQAAPALELHDLSGQVSPPDASMMMAQDTLDPQPMIENALMTSDLGLDAGTPLEEGFPSAMADNLPFE